MPSIYYPRTVEPFHGPALKVSVTGGIGEALLFLEPRGAAYRVNTAIPGYDHREDILSMWWVDDVSDSSLEARECRTPMEFAFYFYWTRLIHLAYPDIRIQFI